MPIKHASIKHLRQTVKRTARNRSVTHRVSELVKTTRKLITAKDKAKATESLKKAIKALDQATQNGVYTKGTAGRLKSRLTTQVNKLA